ncbi:outer membrane beta-barrel protein [Spirosoma soli]|uniref:Outer membrane beta-barrel protein n=1 Tax=Spirosoma soli TaxID=1770529 RepID=A0ABW5M336_9BACT
MKAFLLLGGLLLTITVSSPAQSRVSIAPSYWFNYNPYSYQANLTYNGSNTQFRASGYNIISSFGLTTRYHFTPQWNLSVGVLYNRNTDYIQSPQSPYGEPTPFTSEGWQVPVLVSYRLTSRRLSTYFSTGALLTKSKTFTEAPIRTDGVVGVGLAYQFDSGLSLLLQPTASYPFTKPASDAFYQVTNYSSYSIGLQTQLIWHF